MIQKKLFNLKVFPKYAIVRTYCSIKISFSLDFDLPKDSVLNLRIRGGRNNKNDWYFLQVEDPNMNGFTAISIESTTKLIPMVITGKDLLVKYIIAESSGIQKKSEIELNFRNTLVQSLVEMNKKFELYVELPNKKKISFINPPTINIINDKFDHMTLICPSIVNIGEHFSLLLRVEDQYKNLVKEFQGKIELYSVNLKNNREIKIDEIDLNQQSEGIFRKIDVSFSTSGIHIIKCIYNNHSFTSNPIECLQNKPDKRLYWGYIHGHTNKSDGMRDITEYFNNLLDAGLDFGTNTEHDHLYETSEKDFKEIRANVKKFHKENEFVSFFGYEYGTWFTGYGDICIYHHDDDIPIIRSEINKFNSPSKLNKNLKKYKGKLLMISHHSALRAGYRNWDQFDNSIEKLVEIYSTWGNQEYPYHEGNPLPPRYKFYGYGKHALKRGAILEKKGSFVKDALQKGYKLGFTAGGDDHYGLYPSGQIDPDNGLYPPGIMAIWAKSLTKESIWNALNNRKCYGTTGPRVIINFSIDDYIMGDIIELDNNKKLAEKRILKIKIISPIIINKIEVVRNNILFDKIKHDGNIFEMELEDLNQFDTIYIKHASNKEKFVFYYLRVFLENDNMSWSSPIWIVQK